MRKILALLSALLLPAVALAQSGQLAPSSIFANPTGSTAYGQSVTLGTNLSFSGNVLNATGGGGVSSVTGTAPIVSSGGSTPAISLSGVTSEQGNGAKVQLSTGTTTLNDCVKYDTNGNAVDAGVPCGSGSGSVTSVGLSMPGIFTVSGSPVTTTGTLTATAAGTSGGVPYFSSATTLGSSGALTLNLPVIGGGAGAAPTVGSVTGNTTKFATSTGTLTSGHCTQIDSNGNFIDSGAACGSGGGSLTVTDGTHSVTSTTTLTLGNGFLVSGSAGSATTNLSAPDRTSTISASIAAGDMAGQVNFNGSSLTATIPAISSTIFPSGASALIENFNSSALTISSTPTINGCAASGSLGQYGFITLTSNGTTLDASCFPGYGTITNNALTKFSGTTGVTTASGVTDNGTTVSTSEALTATGTITTGVTGSTQCLHVNTSGVISGTGTDCGSASSGITFTDGTHTVAGSTQLTVTGGTIGGTTPNATLTVTGGGGSTTIVAPQGRLTLQSGTPVQNADQTNVSAVYYVCYRGNSVPYYNGSVDGLDTIASCQVSLTMATTGTGVTNSAGVFDVWWVHGGANRICVATNGSGGGWASDTGGSNTARGTGYSQVHNTRGYWTNVNAITNCYNGTTNYGSVSVDQATYLGTLFTTAAGQTSMQQNLPYASGGSAPVLGLWNAYNREPVGTIEGDSTATWTNATASWHATNSNTNNSIRWVDGLGQSNIVASYSELLNGASSYAYIGVGLDSATANPLCAGLGVIQSGTPSGGAYQAIALPSCPFQPQLGQHTINGMEYSINSTTYAGGAGLTPHMWISVNLNM